MINWTTNVDINASYSVSSRLSVNAIVPFSIINRSSKYEHGGERHRTSASGLADVRLSASYWLLNPA